MNTILAVQQFPDRKRPCLMLIQGNVGHVLGTFRNKECAELMKAFLGGYGISKEMDKSIDELLEEIQLIEKMNETQD